MSRYEKHKMRDPRLPFIFHNFIRPKGSSSGGNWHENIELVCIVSGTATVVTDEQRLSLSAGDIAVVNTNCIHEIFATQNLHFYCLIIDRAFGLANCFDTSGIRFSSLVKDPDLFSLIEQFRVIYFDEESSFRIPRLRSLLLQIATLLCCRHGSTSEKPHEETRLLSSIKSVLGYIHSESHRQLTLDELADIAGMSKCYLSRTFHRLTGHTVMSYINHTRCEKAKTLLAKDEMTVESVARICGFSNVSYFIRTFLSITGMRPGEYRAQFLGHQQDSPSI